MIVLSEEKKNLKNLNMKYVITITDKCIWLLWIELNAIKMTNNVRNRYWNPMNLSHNRNHCFYDLHWANKLLDSIIKTIIIIIILLFCCFWQISDVCTYQLHQCIILKVCIFHFPQRTIWALSNCTEWCMHYWDDWLICVNFCVRFILFKNHVI